MNVSKIELVVSNDINELLLINQMSNEWVEQCSKFDVRSFVAKNRVFEFDY